MLSKKNRHNADCTSQRRVLAVGSRAFSCGRIWVLMLIMLIAVSVAALAQDVPPPPKPADAGPSLEVTLNFIQERLEAVGPVNYIVYFHDNKVGSDYTNSFREQNTRVQATAASCIVAYHTYLKQEDKVTEANLGFRLKEVREVKVLTEEQVMRAGDANAGHPELTHRVDPPVFELVVERTDNKTNGFVFFDESVANRVAQALVHAVELCGGGSKDPF